VTFVNIEDAITARTEFDGAKAKGQIIAVSFAPDRRGDGGFAGRGRFEGRTGGFEGRAGGFGPGAGRGRAPVGLTLADRINKGDLFSRLAPADAPSGPSASSNGKSGPSRSADARGDRPMRSVSGEQSRGGGGGGRGGARRGEKRGPKTVSDLDAELEAFMNAPPPTVGTGVHKAANEEAAKSMHAPKNAVSIAVLDRASGFGTS
jgi:C-terminal duplication domain of Friend of PRMT1